MSSTSNTIAAELERRNAPPRRDAGRARRFYAAVSGPAARKGMLSILDQAIVSGTAFVTSVAIGRTCSQEALGVYYLALTIVFAVQSIQEQAITTPYMIYCHRRRDEALASYTGSTLMHQFGLSALTLVGMLGLIGALALGVGPTGLLPTVWVLLAAVPLLLLRECIRQVAFAHLRLGVAIAVDLTVAVLQLGSLALLLHFLRCIRFCGQSDCLFQGCLKRVA